MRCLLIFLSLFCSCRSSDDTENKKIILTTVAPYKYFIEQIAGNTVQAQVIVPPGANPHAFEPMPRTVEEMGQASLWLRSGDPLEQKIGSMLREKNHRLVFLDLWNGIPPLYVKENSCGEHSGEEGRDLHIWMSPRLAQLQAEKIAGALSALYPEHSSLYAERLKELLQKLQELDAEIGKILAPCKGMAILVSHPAFGYFCQDYGLKQLSVECEGKEPRPQDIAHLIQEAKASDVHTALLQTQYSNKGAERIASELHIPMYFIDPYASDYAANLLYLARCICQKPSE